MLEREDFINYILNNIKGFLPAEYSDSIVECSEVLDVNEALDDMDIRRTASSTYGVAISFDLFYNEYLNGRTLHDILTQMSSLIRDGFDYLETPERRNHARI